MGQATLGRSARGNKTAAHNRLHVPAPSSGLPSFGAAAGQRFSGRRKSAPAAVGSIAVNLARHTAQHLSRCVRHLRACSRRIRAIRAARAQAQIVGRKNDSIRTAHFDAFQFRLDLPHGRLHAAGLAQPRLAAVDLFQVKAAIAGTKQCMRDCNRCQRMIRKNQLHFLAKAGGEVRIAARGVGKQHAAAIDEGAQLLALRRR